MNRDRILSQFLGETGADPGLARDILEGNQWSFVKAMEVFDQIQRTSPPKKTSASQSNVEIRKAKVPMVDKNQSQSTITRAKAIDEPDRGLSGTGGVVKADEGVVKPKDSAGQKRLERGISKAGNNFLLIDEARTKVLHDIAESTNEDESHFVETPEFTFILPDLTIYNEDFRAFLEKDLIEMSTLVSLEQAGRLNWWAETGACQRLLPMATTGDGNCLLHAASLGMWGFHDRQLTLRRALHTAMKSGMSSGLLRRWRWQQTMVNKQSGLILSEEEWDKEWACLLDLASSNPRYLADRGTCRRSSCCDSPATKGSMLRTGSIQQDYYESLEEIHVFILAHVLHRPIIVIADLMLKDINGEAMAPIPFGGIYLPIECDPKTSFRSPLLLTYDTAHFSALVAMETQWKPGDIPKPPALIPVIGPDFKLLPLHFAIDPGNGFNWDSLNDNVSEKYQLTTDKKLELLEAYMDIGKVPVASPDIVNDSNKPIFQHGHEDDAKSSSSEGSENGKDKNKMGKQMHTVAKKMGSLGKNLKKNVGKAFKKIGNDNKDHKKSSMNKIVQSTRTVTPDLLTSHTHIIVASIQHKHSAFEQDMVKNYLAEAKMRFDDHKSLYQARAVELKQAADKRCRSNDSTPSQCITPGCSMYGTSSTNYLCSGCHKNQMQQAMGMQQAHTPSEEDKTLLNLAKNANNQNTANDYKNADHTLPLYAVATNPPILVDPNRTDTLINSGESKFYTEKTEDHSVERMATDKRVPNTLQFNDSKFYAGAGGHMMDVGRSGMQQSTVYPSSRSQHEVKVGSRSPVIGRDQINMARSAVEQGQGYIEIPVHHVKTDNSVPNKNFSNRAGCQQVRTIMDNHPRPLGAGQRSNVPSAGRYNGVHSDKSGVTTIFIQKPH